MGASMAELEHLGNRYNYFLQPLTDIHLRSGMPFEMEVGGIAVLMVGYQALKAARTNPAVTLKYE
jgi:hypothetical protein